MFFEYGKKPTKASGCTAAHFWDYGDFSICHAMSSCEVRDKPHGAADQDGVTIELALLA